MITVRLTDYEMAECIREAHERQRAVKARQAQSNGPTVNPIEQDLVGILGEVAFAKWSGQRPTAPQGQHFNQNTDFPNCEVRTRSKKSGGTLFVKNKKFNQQPPSTIYVLAWADPQSLDVELVGWTTLGTIADYGYPGPYDSTRFEAQGLQPMETLTL